MQFRTWIESETRESYYHVTYWKNLNNIGFYGLIRNARPNFAARSDLFNNSQRGLFIANQAVTHWVSTLQNWAYHNSDNIKKDGLIPIVLRVQARPSLASTDDYPGNPEGAFVYPKNIRSNHLEMWDGIKWTQTISRQAINLNIFIEKEGVPGEGSWWSFKEPYPYPPDIK